MSTRNGLLLIGIAFTIAACEPMNTRAMAPTVPTPVCATPAACEMQWAAARRWVNDHMHMKIQTYSETYFETFNDPDGTWAGARVSKEPNGDGTYRIVGEFGCSNMFGCVPSVVSLLADFNAYVRAAVPSSQ